ncbi:MAG TPA: preprotein translocase subunit SecE [Deltaproteobacteria bacterium]|nr:preprotein translocase subunit SecE [Deltaproteobacteria bacterium]
MDERDRFAALTKIRQFFHEIRAEWNKITWTGKNEVTSGTIAVVILSVVIAVFLATIDSGLSWIVRLVLGAG